MVSMRTFLLSAGLVTIASITTATTSYAQEQVQSTSEDNASNLKWSGRINFGGLLTDGNTNKKAVSLDGRTSARTKKNRYTVGAEIYYAEDEGEETQNEYIAYGEYDRFVNDELFYGGRASYEVDDLADLDYRLKVGPYVGYQFYESEPLNLSTRLGLDYIKEETEGGDVEESAAVSWGVDYDQKLIEDTIQVFYKHDTSLPVDDVEGFLYNGETGVRFPIAKVITGTAQIDFDWDNDPAEGARESDVRYTLKLGYEF